MLLSHSLDLLSRAHPSLAQARASLEEEWRPDTPPPTLLSSALAKALLAVTDRASDDELVHVLAHVETILSEGDDVSKDVVATGFLEALSSAGENGSAAAHRLRALLGPLASAYCKAWESFARHR